MTDLPHNFHSEWRECQSPTDPEMSAVRGEYLVADKLPDEDAITIAIAPEALRALRGCLSAWDRLFPLFPVSEAIEDAEFNEFARARSVLAQAARKDA